MVGSRSFAAGRDSDGSRSVCNALSARTTVVNRPAAKHQPHQQQQHPKTVEAKRRALRRPHHHQHLQNVDVRANLYCHAMPTRHGMKERSEETLMLAATTPTVTAGSDSARLLVATSDNQTTAIDNNNNNSSRLQQQQLPLQTTLRTPTPAPAPQNLPRRRGTPPPAADRGCGAAEARQRGGNTGGDRVVLGRTNTTTINVDTPTTPARKLHTSQEAVIAVETRADALSPVPPEKRPGRKASAEVSVL